MAVAAAAVAVVFDIEAAVEEAEGGVEVAADPASQLFGAVG